MKPFPLSPASTFGAAGEKENGSTYLFSDQSFKSFDFSTQSQTANQINAD